MNRLLSFTEGLNRLGVWIGGTLLFLTSFMIAVEVVLRKIFSISMGGADELSSYVLAISCSWAFGYALLRKAHIRIDVLHARMPLKARFACDFMSLLAFLIYLVPLVYFAFLVVKTSVVRSSTANTPLQTPLWIPQGLWFAGLVLFLLTVIVLFVVSIMRIAGKDLSAAERLISPSTIEDEIEEETGVDMRAPSEGGEQ